MTLDEFLAGQSILESSFAETIGVDQSTVNRLRKGQVPSRKVMLAIHQATGGAVTANDFFGITPTPQQAKAAQMSQLSTRVADLIIDPVRAREFINPEFVAHGSFLLLQNERGEIGARYDALPAAAAAEPAAFGCIVGEDEGHGEPPALVAMTWDGSAVRLQRISPSVVVRTSTVAGRGGVASVSPEGQPITCTTCEVRVDAVEALSCSALNCPRRVAALADANRVALKDMAA